MDKKLVHWVKDYSPKLEIMRFPGFRIKRILKKSEIPLERQGINPDEEWQLRGYCGVGNGAFGCPLHLRGY